jgi:type IV pilus assembly protein PilQ
MEVSMAISTLFFAAFLSSAQLLSIDAKDMDLSDFFRLIGKAANVNVVLHPAVQGRVNLTVQEVPWEQLLDVVLKNHALEKDLQGNILRIVPLSILEAEAKQRAATEQARFNALPLQTRVVVLNYAKAEDMAVIVSTFLSPRGSVVVYPPQNALIIRDVAPPAPSR